MPAMPTDFSCGVIPITEFHGERHYLLVQHDAGHWSFPKGHPEGNESPQQTARRELGEETGLRGVSLVPTPAFDEHYIFTKRSGKVVDKTVTYFLGHVDPEAARRLRLQVEEVADAKWLRLAAAHGLMTFDAGRLLLDEVERFLSVTPAALRQST